MSEKWKGIPGYEGRYQVSDRGRVFSFRRLKHLRCSLDGRGYLRVMLCYKGKGRTHRVHRLVWAAFKGEWSTRETQINHKDGVKTNNRLENLEVVTGSQNIQHAYRLGLIPTKLTENDVRDIYSRRAKGDSMRKLAAEYKVSSTTIWYVCHGRNWNHIK